MRWRTVIVMLLSGAGLLHCGSTDAQAQAQAPPEVRIIETWPPGDEVILGRDQTFYLHLAYDTEQPLQIWAHPMFRGEPAAAGSNPSPVYTGQGEALVWFFLNEPGVQVDEVRISAGDGGLDTPVVAVWRGHVSGRRGRSIAPEPGWAMQLKQEAKASMEQARLQAASEPPGLLDGLLVGGFLLVMPLLGLLAIGAPAYGVLRWQGGWRLAAALPAAVMGFVVLRIIAGTMIDPTSHNLWPFEILQAGVPCLLWMVGLVVVRRVSGGSRAAA